MVVVEFCVLDTASLVLVAEVSYFVLEVFGVCSVRFIKCFGGDYGCKKWELFRKGMSFVWVRFFSCCC